MEEVRRRFHRTRGGLFAQSKSNTCGNRGIVSSTHGFLTEAKTAVQDILRNCCRGPITKDDDYWCWDDVVTFVRGSQVACVSS